ncbi:MAG TPA: alpha/beta hydrolase [Saprospiraceae bacterium]|nr:alpha/beta hydrolase [Saprospiraceae bacterium]
MESRYIQANGLTFHVKESGEGPLLLLLHGFPEFWHSWHKVIPLLNSDFKVIAVDMRGYGRSDKPRFVRDYHYKTLAADIAGIIDAFNVNQAIVVGHDWGAGVAWSFASLYPGMVEKLIIINCPPPSLLFKSLITRWQQFKMSWYILFFQLPFIPEWWMNKNRKSFFWGILRGSSVKKEVFTKEIISEYEKSFTGQSDFRGPAHYYRAAARALREKEYRTTPLYSVETLVIWGMQDKAMGPWFLDDLPRYFTNKFKIERLQNCSHWVQHEEPEITAQLIRDFVLGKVES